MSSNTKLGKILIKTFKVVAWIVISIILLLVIVAAAIQIPAIQNKISQKAVSFLEGKIGTEVSLDHISLSLPKKIVLTGFYLEDQSKDTLLYAGKLGIDTDLWALTRNEIQLNDIELEELKANIKRSKTDSAFNFDYIIDAFADTVTVKDTTAQAWDFSLGEISLTDIDVSFKDSLEGNDVSLFVGDFEISTDDFDLNKAVIHLDEINLSNVKARVVQTRTVEAAVDSIEVLAAEPQSFPFDVSFNEINLDNIDAGYTHHGTGQIIKLNLKEAGIEADDIDVTNRIIKLEKFLLANTFISYQQMSDSSAMGTSSSLPAEKNQHNNEQPTKEKPWQISLSELDLQGNTIQYHDFTKPTQQGVVDFNHLWISGLTTNAQNLEVNGTQLEGELNNLSFREKSGFAVASFKAAFAVRENGVVINDFVFTTANSNIAFDANADFKSLADIANSYPEATIDLSINSSKIALRDILYFNPSLLDKLSLNVPRSSAVYVHASVRGAINNLDIEHLRLKTLGNTAISAQGTIRGLPDMNKAFMDIKLNKFYTIRSDVKNILPSSSIPQSIEMPAWINLAGTFKGTLQTPEVHTTLKTDMGTVRLNAVLNLDSTVRENYEADLVIDAFDVGRLLKQPATMGTLDLSGWIKGAGLKMDNLDALMNVTIDSFQYNDYTYKNFKIDGSMKKYFFSGVALLEDKNLDLRLEGDLDYNEEVPVYKFTFDLKNADFKALNLSQRPLKARGIIDVNLATSDFQILNGNVDIRKFAVYNGNDLYAVDSLLFASIDQKGKSEISIKSDILSGNFEGTINLFSLPDVLKQHINQYFSLKDTLYNKPLQDQNFKFNLVIKNTDLITEVLLPDLDPFVPGEIAGEFDSRRDRLNLRVNLAKMSYAGVAVDSIGLKILSDNQSLDYTFTLRDIMMDTMRISALRLAGNVMNDSIHTNFMILDSLEQEKYFLGGVVNSFEDAFQFKFLQSQVVLNYEEWTTPLYNSLRFTKDGIVPNNFLISKGDERILLLRRDDADSTISVMFNQVDLKNITSLIEGTTPVGGKVNGDLNIGAAEKGAFTSHLSINELNIFEQHWGDLILQLGQTADGPFNIDLKIEGDNAELYAGGYITDAPSSEIHFTANVPRLDLQIAEPLTMGQLKNMKGTLQAELNINGSTAKPTIDGALTFKEANFIATYVNSEFTITDETIRLKGTDILFDDFDILDNKKNVATINGSVTTGLTQGLGLNLNLSAEDFQILNTTENDNELFYGNVRINTQTKVSGTSDIPNVDMNIALSDESVFTFVVPQSERGVLEQKGIVVFVDKDAKNDPFLASINPKDTAKAKFTGLNLTANIELSDAETFNIVIDPVTGDKLSVKGNSTLTFEMDPTGDMQLSGRYEITEGSYDLSFYKLVKRNFSIDKGSTITWAGDPMDATMDIRAIYELETSPIELVANQVEQNDLNKYKQQLPFLVFLQIKGELLSPEISFKLDMPQDEQDAFGGNVYAKIRDINTRESDLNKQVFALLILRRFISDNPFDNQAGGGVESTARRSVSKLLTEQLNRLSQNVKGVELSFDVKSYEDFSSGAAENQTELQLGLSKSLFDDRLVVKVSGNVGLEGEATTDQNAVTDFIGDLALEYKLTEDGRFRITGFRNSNYDMIDGELIETGAGLIYIKDYNSLRELFKANAKNE